ncbi:ParB/RepB/Spo0J family partition protein [Marichromatium gracile]|uniref:Probable chromosome-partitioning protein ParB n=1 Tax=Marichromatium gracile TaxID=1048 RepID=A0A4R4AKH5_MARGR|nr:ParB/RepB/Spo0J family partition protein [Marichromatium gracile]MBK1707756.1 chromosome partitioning protein ParB [Marichromatium gracile]TCW39745.1 chromosome segregation DNA-binding protein [Marichromatium gracile]
MDQETTRPNKKKGLGRGLDALLGATRGGAETASQSGAVATAQPGDRIVRLPLEQLQRGRYQPRRDFDPEALRELAESIRAQGVLQPILARPLAEGRYEIVAGERRWRACQQAGLSEIPALVRELDATSALAIALIENIQRADLNPLEEATALHRLVEEFELTHQEVAEAVGKSRTTISNLLRLLELEPEVKDQLDHGRLEMGHARALLGVKGQMQCALARQVVAGGLSVRDTERLVRRQQQGESPVAAADRKGVTDPDIRRLQNDLTDRLGAEVRIQHGSRGNGKLVISYTSLDELDGILGHIR